MRYGATPLKERNGKAKSLNIIHITFNLCFKHNVNLILHVHLCIKVHTIRNVMNLQTCTKDTDGMG